jgi:hypothetical protein
MFTGHVPQQVPVTHPVSNRTPPYSILLFYFVYTCPSGQFLLPPGRATFI